MSNITKQLNDLITSTLGSEEKDNGLNNSVFSDSKYQQRRLDPIYQSSSPSLNEKFIKYSSPSKTRNAIELIVPQHHSPFVSRASNKIRKEISTITQSLTGVASNGASSNDFYSSSPSQKNTIEGYRNRPVLNLQRNDLDFSAKNYIIDSPANRMVISPTIFRSSVKESNYYRSNSNQFKTSFKPKKETMNGIVFNQNTANHDLEEYNRFMRDMSAWKNKKINEWKKL